MAWVGLHCHLMKFGASAQLCPRYSSPDGHHHFQMAEAVPGPSRGMCALLPINLSACPVFEEPGTVSVNESAPECPEPSLPLDPCAKTTKFGQENNRDPVKSEFQTSSR